MDSYYILDTETASLHGGVCEIAYLELDDKLDIVSEFCTRTNPERSIDAGATLVHGISDADVVDCPTLATVADFCFDGPIRMMAYNLPFDRRMVAPHIKVLEGMCIFQLARKHITGTTNHKLEVLQKELNLSEQKSHSALGDVHTTREVLLHILKLLDTDFKTLWTRAQEPQLVHKMPFGKHKGKTIAGLPADYRKWLLTQEIDNNLRFTLTKYIGM